MAVFIYDPWSSNGAHFADSVHETIKPQYSELLGPDGQPLQYKQQKMGFDLTPRKQSK